MGRARSAFASGRAVDVAGGKTHLAAEHLLEQVGLSLGGPQVDIRIALRLNHDADHIIAHAGLHVGYILLVRAVEGEGQSENRGKGAHALLILGRQIKKAAGK